MEDLFDCGNCGNIWIVKVHGYEMNEMVLLRVVSRCSNIHSVCADFTKSSHVPKRGSKSFIAGHDSLLSFSGESVEEKE